MISAFTNQNKTNQQHMRKTKTISLKHYRQFYVTGTLSGIMQLKLKTSLMEYSQLVTWSTRHWQISQKWKC